MNGIFRKLMTLWCVTCGLVVPPAVCGVVLAQSMGILDLHPLVDRIQGTDDGTAEPTDATTDSTDDDTDESDSE